MIHVRSVLIGIVIGAASMGCILYERKALNSLTMATSFSMKSLEKFQVANTSNSKPNIHAKGDRKVVLVTKIHDSQSFRWLCRALCLLHAGYNKQRLHDVVIFTTIPLEAALVDELVRIAHPAKLTVSGEWGNKTTIQEHLDTMTPKQQEVLVGRCKDVNSTDQLNWRTRCADSPRLIMPIAYNWMSEFRSKYLWREPILQEYRYMIWFDYDAWIMEAWKEDPINYMVEKNLVLFLVNFGLGETHARLGVHQRILDAYNQTICDMGIKPDGYLQVKYGIKNCLRASVRHVHGFMHITDLEYYRDPSQLRWFDSMVGDGRFQRAWDDQLAIMVAAAMAPNRTAEMIPLGFDPKVVHHRKKNGKGKVLVGGYPKYWRDSVKEKFPEAWEACPKFF